MHVLVPGSGVGASEEHDGSAPLVFTVPDALPPGDCALLIQWLEEAGFGDAPVTTFAGPVMMPDIRNNQRVIFDHEELAERLYARVAGSLPVLRGARPVGVNERFRAYRYEPGQRFAPHRDGRFARDERERTELTFMIYLNEGFDGGATRFWEHDLDVVPKTGLALLFQHRLLHEGCVVTGGVKYVLRSDILYRYGDE